MRMNWGIKIICILLVTSLAGWFFTSFILKRQKGEGVGGFLTSPSILRDGSAEMVGGKSNGRDILALVDDAKPKPLVRKLFLSANKIAGQPSGLVNNLTFDSSGILVLDGSMLSILKQYFGGYNIARTGASSRGGGNSDGHIIPDEISDDNLGSQIGANFIADIGQLEEKKKRQVIIVAVRYFNAQIIEREYSDDIRTKNPGSLENERVRVEAMMQDLKSELGGELYQIMIGRQYETAKIIEKMKGDPLFQSCFVDESPPISQLLSKYQINSYQNRTDLEVEKIYFVIDEAIKSNKKISEDGVRRLQQMYLSLPRNGD